MISKQKLVSNLSQIPGWRTKRKIIVFESDDWGSIRMPSNDVRKSLQENGVLSSNPDHYNLYDSLESNDDLTALFELLSKFKDANRNHPVFTGLNVVANPDFEKIKNDNFEKYYYEPFTETLKWYSNHDRVAELWREGAEKRLFEPQFHGREHLNVTSWLKGLREEAPKTRIAFDHGFWGLNPVPLGESPVKYLAAFDIYDPEEIDYLKTVIQEGSQLFKSIMGYGPSFFVPPNTSFSLKLLDSMKVNGIQYVLIDKFQKEPTGHGQYRTHFRYLGKQNNHGQIYLSRNASFEPAAVGKDWVSECLQSINRAFRWRKPATISTHRVNYIGHLDPQNRDHGLTQLRELLTQILKKWPDVEFMTSVELGNLIRADKGLS
jgi:hypothetical protein